MHKTGLKSHREELVFFDPKNPRALVNMVPEAFAKRMKALINSPEATHFGLSEPRLKLELIRQGKCPTPTDNRIRLQFWLEYDRVQQEELRAGMNFSYVVGFAMAKELFYSHYIQCPWAMLWLLCPPVHYVTVLEDAIRHATDRLVEVLSADLKKSNGEYNFRMLEFILRSHERLHRQLIGMEGSSPSKEIVPEPSGPSQEEIQRAAADLEEARESKRQRIEELKKKAAAQAAQVNTPPKVEDAEG